MISDSELSKKRHAAKVSRFYFVSRHGQYLIQRACVWLRSPFSPPSPFRLMPLDSASDCALTKLPFNGIDCRNHAPDQSFRLFPVRSAAAAAAQTSRAAC